MFRIKFQVSVIGDWIVVVGKADKTNRAKVEIFMNLCVVGGLGLLEKELKSLRSEFSHQNKDRCSWQNFH